MFFDSMFAQPSPSPTPDGLDPALASLFASAGIDPASLMGGGQASQPQSLAEALIGSAMTVSGRQGLTGQSFTGALPPWAQHLPTSVTSNADFDPYLGVVSQQGDERVYFGDTAHHKTVETPANKFASEMGGPTTTETVTTHSDKTMTVVQAMNLPYTWDESEVADTMKRMKAAGVQVNSFDDLVSAWGSLVNRAAMTYSLSEGKRHVTPWDVLDLYKSEAQAAGTWVDPNRKETVVQRNVTDITEGEAWSNLQNTLSQMLGRDPSDQETRDFTYRMNQLAASNPTISKTITKYKNGEVASTSTHTDPGFTSADMAQEAYTSAQNQPDYAEYRGASYLFNAAMQALGPIGG